MTPAERVTADRPALSRITAERRRSSRRAFWRRLIARGPRHPLVLSLIAILLPRLPSPSSASAALAHGDKLGRRQSAAPRRASTSRSVAIVVLNGSSTPALADGVADDLKSQASRTVRTGLTGSVEPDPRALRQGLQARGRRRSGASSEIKVLQPLDRETQAAIAPDADVVVIAGEDRAKG